MSLLQLNDKHLKMRDQSECGAKVESGSVCWRGYAQLFFGGGGAGGWGNRGNSAYVRVFRHRSSGRI